MKKLLLLLSAFMLLFIISMVVSSCETPKTERDYIEFCENDTMIVGYEYVFVYNDSADMNYSIFNPYYADMLAKYGKLTYADTSDVVSARSYYLVLRGMDEKIAELPKGSKPIKITPEATWIGYIEWKDKK